MATIERKDVKPSDQWDLSSLYSGPEAWEADFKKYQDLYPKAKS
jgi:oligoendopeptidase F